ncbi:MAG: hypothetical protein JXB42_11505, partial [Deltaproteobacteria bacterium]|nr:hypothetical protein [Deltaproteobacteria bacterium]
MLLCSSFRLVMRRSDQRKNEMRRLLTLPTDTHDQFILVINDYRLSSIPSAKLDISTSANTLHITGFPLLVIVFSSHMTSGVFKNP